MIECVEAYIAACSLNASLLNTKPLEECITLDEDPWSFNPERVGTQACPAGISWLSQSWHACGLSAANVLLTACHASAYWRSEVERDRSSGLHRGRKGEVWLVLEHRELLRRSWSTPSPHFHACGKLSLIRCLSRERGERVGGNVFLTLSVQGCLEVPVEVWFIICMLLRVGRSRHGSTNRARVHTFTYMISTLVCLRSGSSQGTSITLRWPQCCAWVAVLWPLLLHFYLLYVNKNNSHRYIMSLAWAAKRKVGHNERNHARHTHTHTPAEWLF